MENIIIRKANSNDCKHITNLLDTVFLPEKVGELSEVLFKYYPGIRNEDWFLAEDISAKKVVASFTLIPWEWNMDGIKLKVAEMGLVGTHPDYQGRGLQKLLNCEFDKTMKEENFDLGVIQGIPGFYHKFGYYYALPLNNHINLSLKFIPEITGNSSFTFRKANENDIPFLMEQDILYQKHYSISVVRNKAKWEYIFGEGKNSEYGSEIWIFENSVSKEKCYVRILNKGGFGKGLIITEISINASLDALLNIFLFLKKLCSERNKPFIRFDLPNDSEVGKYAIYMGAQAGTPYAWQIKIINKVSFLNKIKSLLEIRLKASLFSNYSGILNLNFYSESIDIQFEKGQIVSIEKSQEMESPNSFCISNDLFPALCLGHRSWKELHYIRPDVSVVSQHTDPVYRPEEISGLLIDVLFPKTSSWIYEEY